MPFAATFRGVDAAVPVPSRTTTARAALETGSFLALPGWGVLRVVVAAIIDSRRRKAMREMRRHQAFGPLVAIRHIGLTRAELLPF